MCKEQDSIQYGEFIFTLKTEPASYHSPRELKDNYKGCIRNAIKDCKNIFIREVGVQIEWKTSQNLRYETDKSYDIDNIIKPTLDAMCGIDGLFIDDCQV